MPGSAHQRCGSQVANFLASVEPDVHEIHQSSVETPDRAELIRFFSVLSHDLKSPIFSIDGFSDLLLSDYGDKLEGEGRDFLQRIRSAAQQMRRTLDAMSHMVKLLSRPITRKEINLTEVMDELRLKYNFMIEAGGVTLEIPSVLPVITGDLEKIREAFGAVLSNAMIFTDRPPGERRVSLSASQNNEMHEFIIADNGSGMDPRYVHQIFELGLKLDKSRGEGPGYGLYLAKQILESHGGALSVQTSPGEGSQFLLTLPA